MSRPNPAPRVPPALPLPPAPVPGETVKIPLDQLHEYLVKHGLKVSRRVDGAGGGWHVELVAVDGAGVAA